MTKKSWALVASCMLVAPAVPAQEIAFLPRSTPARFNLSPAGARALGLGGAFVAVADDATAAAVNPAGLSRLDRPQLLVSFAASSFETELEGGLAGPGATVDESVAGPAFVGYAWPLGRLTLAGYYQQDGRFESGFRLERPADALALWASPIVYDERRYEQQVETFGVAAGARVGRAVSVGAGLSSQRLGLEWSSEVRYDLAGLNPNLELLAPFGFRDVIDDRDSDPVLTLGLLVHPEGRWTGGLSYSQGGDFELEGTFAAALGQPGAAAPRVVQLALPDTLSAGAAFRPRERWLLSAQLSHLTYSDLEEEPAGCIAIFPPVCSGPIFAGDEPIDDATQIHLGAEVRLGSGQRPITLRAGAWSDPDHDGVRGIDGDQIHAALGAGAVLGRRWGLDGALRASDAVTEGVFALSYRM